MPGQAEQDLEVAVALLRARGLRAVGVMDGRVVFEVSKPGLLGLVEALGCGVELCGVSVADRVLGKAAALLYTRAGVRRLHGEVVSEAALSYLRRRSVEVSFARFTKHILGPGGGVCPFEAEVVDVDEPEEGYRRVLKILSKMREFKG